MNVGGTCLHVVTDSEEIASSARRSCSRDEVVCERSVRGLCVAVKTWAAFSLHFYVQTGFGYTARHVLPMWTYRVFTGKYQKGSGKSQPRSSAGWHKSVAW